MYEKISKLIKELFKDCEKQFLDGIDNYSFENLMSAKDIKYDIGATKICLFFEEYPNYVIKIPFVRYNGSQLEKANSILPEAFQNDYENWDYCAVEGFIYDAAKKDGINELFYETEYLLDMFGYPIYIQKKVPFILSSLICNEDKGVVEKFLYLDADKRKTLYLLNEEIFEEYAPGEVNNISKIWLYDCFNYYGKEFYKKAVIFISKYCNDLHTGNIGYTKDWKPVIFDYSSYSESL